VTHSPDQNIQAILTGESDKSFMFWGAKQLAEQAARNGLIGWLKDKAS
jgi:hypothetical protein